MTNLLEHPLTIGTEYNVEASDCCLNVRFKSVFLGYRDEDSDELVAKLPPDPDDHAEPTYYMARTEWANGVIVEASRLEEGN